MSAVVAKAADAIETEMRQIDVCNYGEGGKARMASPARAFAVGTRSSQAKTICGVVRTAVSRDRWISKNRRSFQVLDEMLKRSSQRTRGKCRRPEMNAVVNVRNSNCISTNFPRRS